MEYIPDNKDFGATYNTDPNERRSVVLFSKDPTYADMHDMYRSSVEKFADFIQFLLINSSNVKEFLGSQRLKVKHGAHGIDLAHIRVTAME